MLYSTKNNIRNTANEISQKAYGYSTGFRDLDSAIFGMHQSELIIVAGRSSMGKSALLTNIAARSAVQIPQLIFSCEMPNRPLMERMLSDTSEVPFYKLKRGDDLNEAETDRMKKAITKLENRPIFIDDRSVLTPSVIRDCCEKFSSQVSKEFVVYVDYLQLMTPDVSRSNRVLEIDTILADLRSIMKDFEIPIVVACQLNREVERRQDHEPRLSDLRESGGIEQAADVVLLIHRPSYYRMKEINLDTEDDGEAYIFIAKQRNGATGKIPMIWIPEFMGFRGLGSLDEGPGPLYEEENEHMQSITQEVEQSKQEAPAEEMQEAEQPKEKTPAESSEEETMSTEWDVPVDESNGEVGIPNPDFMGGAMPTDDSIPF